MNLCGQAKKAQLEVTVADERSASSRSSLSAFPDARRVTSNIGFLKEFAADTELPEILTKCAARANPTKTPEARLPAHIDFQFGHN